MRRSPWALVLVMACVLLAASPALSASSRGPAADDGVHVDPDSAPAAEYALPLEAARRAAAASSGDGAAGAGAGAAGPPPAFGRGITPKPAAADRPGSRPGASAALPQPGAATSPVDAPPPAAASPTRIADADGDPLLYSLGGVLAVIAAGGLMALTLRRRQPTA